MQYLSMANALLYRKLKYFRYSTQVSKVAVKSNFNHRLRIKSRIKVCLHLKRALHTSTKVKRVDKDGEEVVAHCEKGSNDSVELAGMCKLEFLTILVTMFWFVCY